MLVEFSVTNYRSFREKQTLSMVAGTGKEHQQTHTLDSGVDNFDRLLASSALYGPNAAGKTNLLKAIQFMQSVVVNSASANPVLNNTYVPYKFDIFARKEPSKFEVTFIEGGIRYEYGFSLDANRIYCEKLIEYRTKNPRCLFNRQYANEKDEYNWTFSSYLKGNKNVWKDATRANALFLSTAVQLNSVQLVPIFWWFQKRLVVIAGNIGFNMGLTIKLLDEPGGKDRLLPFIREADAGVSDVEVTQQPFVAPHVIPLQGTHPFVYQASPNLPPTLPTVTFSHLSNDTKEPVSIDISDESNGTQLLFQTAGAWLNVFANGEVLLVDEIERSLHPLLVKFLIGKFHFPATNPQKAQLIFSTHNTFLLDQSILRRDQIWFVEKTSSNTSRLYPLSDFSPRNDEAIERWYMRGRYGALPVLEDIKL
jgi:AAA15 family ATPase/GTPase